MWVDYKLKKTKFSHEEQQVELQGVQDNTTTCTPINAVELKGLLKHGAVSHCI
jgi:hypothetical protein